MIMTFTADGVEENANSPKSVETVVASIWSDVLGVAADRIQPGDHFFAKGGDSLRLVHVLDHLNKRFFDGGKEGLRITDLLVHTTVKTLAHRITQKVSREEAGIPRGNDVVEGPCDVAIIGMSVRLPGARNASEFWNNLCQGVESIQSFTEEQLLAAGVQPDRLKDESYVRRGSVLEWRDAFDADYFNITPREVAIASVQQRILIECSEEALQDGGYGWRGPGVRVGVFTGCSRNGTVLRGKADDQEFLETPEGITFAAVNSSAATRIAYILDLKGPSMSVDTACSSSLVAVHQACISLLNGDCELALAGGASVRPTGPRGYRYLRGGVLSADGRCRPFDRRANGTVFTSGVGMVLLKRRADALRDGDTIYAVICGSAVNNDGRDKLGYTAPSFPGQVGVIRDALAQSGIPPASVGFIETHGTGTAIGDPVEILALNEMYGNAGRQAASCALGTLKANVGHLEAAAGVAGLVKASLVLWHKKIPPAIHFEEPSAEIDFSRTPFFLNTRLQEWPRGQEPRRAAVSAFGIGGTNAHVILQEPEQRVPSTSHRRIALIPVSARTPSALRTSCRVLAPCLSNAKGPDLLDAAYTLQVGRRTHDWRFYTVSTESTEAAARFNEFAESTKPLSRRDCAQATVFMFPGQGSQHADMAAGLYQEEPVFRESLDLCAGLAQKECGADLRDIIFAASLGPAGCSEAIRFLDETQYAQPALFSVEYALAQLWHSLGVLPSLIIGHSLGEYVAACIAGVFTLEDALRLVCKRGRLMQSTPPGLMLSVALSCDELGDFLDPEIAVAAINAERSCVLAGASERIERLAEQLNARGVVSAKLKTAHAFHSPLMHGVAEEFRRALDSVQISAVRTPFVSNLTGQAVRTGTMVAREHWVAHMMQPVQFLAGMRMLFQGSRKAFIEVGPGTTLTTLARRMPGARDHVFATTLRHPQSTGPDEAALMDAVGQLWASGIQIDWVRFNARTRCCRVSLPTYPFERKSCETDHDLDPHAGARSGQESDHAVAHNPEARRGEAGRSVEAEIVAIWERLLGRESISLSDNFFDLGGDSVLMLQLRAAIANRLGAQLPLKEWVSDPTVSGLARLVNGSGRR
jgi:acyl transferase domain-containing protein